MEATFDDADSQLTPELAEQLLDGHDLVTAMAGTIPDMKVLRDRCLEAGIPALIGCPGGGRSCGPKTHLLIREAEMPRLSVLLRDEWHGELERQGLGRIDLAALNATAEASEHPPCPACGTAAALVDGACSDCGLQLE
jgi:hypothetical protein